MPRVPVCVASLMILSLVVLPSARVYAVGYEVTWSVFNENDPQKQPFAHLLVKYATQDNAAGTRTVGVNVSLTYVNDAAARLDWIEFYNIAVHLRNTPNGTDVAVSSTDSSHTRVNAGGRYTNMLSVRAPQSGQFFVALTWKTTAPRAIAYGLTIREGDLSYDTGYARSPIPKVTLNT